MTMNRFEAILDFIFSTIALVSMTTLWLPFHNAALSLSMLQMLLIIDPCVAFRQPFFSAGAAGQRTTTPRPQSALHADFKGASSGWDKKYDEAIPNKLLTENEEVRRRPEISEERLRKLVDRTNVYMDTSPFDSEPEEEVDDEELCYLDDMLGEFAGETCFVSDSSSLSSDPDSARLLEALPFNIRIPPATTDLALRYLPFIMPLLAYSTYEYTAMVFEKTVEFLSHNNWVAVDGGQYQANIITPAINGLVVPSMALLFATMTSNTITTLRQRQLQIRTSLNTEANDLRMISTMVDSLPPELRGVKNQLREYLVQYASRVIAESRPGISVDLQMFIGSMDTEMVGFLGMWNKLSMGSYGTMYVDTMLAPASHEPPGPHPNDLGLAPDRLRGAVPFLAPIVFSEVYDAMTRLRHERSTRLSSLQATYPALHYVILGLLAGSICTVFLMETNQELLIFLSAIQLRILWSMLIGTFSALAVVNYDMRDPFRGSYNVAVSVDQFYTFRESIRATIQMDQKNAKDDDVDAVQSAER